MNKHFIQNILRFLLLIVIVFSSGCGQSIVADSQTLTPTLFTIANYTATSNITKESMASITPDLVACPTIQTPSSEIEKIADEWFSSINPDFLSRDNYNPQGITEWGWGRFCEEYRAAIVNNDYWINEPILFAMRLAGYPNPDNLAPDSVMVFFKKGSAYIATVVILDNNLMDESIKDSEKRVDIVKGEEYWEIQWIGFRQHCRRTSNDDWVTTLCP